MSLVFAGWFRAVVKESGMKDGGESAVEMRPRKEDESFLCAGFSAVFCLLEGRGGRDGDSATTAFI